jgi:hypothetical protein
MHMRGWPDLFPVAHRGWRKAGIRTDLIVKLDRFYKYFSPWAVLVEAILRHPFGAGGGGAGKGVVAS